MTVRAMRTDWRLIGLLFVAGLLAAAQFAKVALTLGDLVAVYPGTPLPFAVSALSLAGILFGVTAGLIVARVGARRALLTAMAGAAAFSFVEALLPPFPVFMALRALEGLTHLTIVVASPTLMAAVASPRDKPVAMGLWGTFFGVGFALSAVVIPWLDGPRTVFIVHGAGFLILFLALWPLLPRGVARDASHGSWLSRHAEIYTNPRLVAPALGFLWHTLMFLGLLTYLPKFLGAWTAPVLPLIALIGTFGAGVLARSIAPRRLLIWAFGMSIAGLLLALAMPDESRPWIILPLFAILGLVPGASFANVPALNPDPADQARANGAIAQLGNVGTAATTPLFAVSLGFGLAGPLTFAVVICVIGLVVVCLIHRKIAETP